MTASSWVHPELGPIDPLPVKLRPKKVWKHFYLAEEHWERLCGQDVAAMRREGEAAIGATRAEHDELPSVGPEREDKARALLLRHHDVAYGPAYRVEMEAPGTAWTPAANDKRRYEALTPGSVFLVVQSDRPRSWVVTVFRPHPMTRGVEWDEAEIRRHGVRYFKRRTGMSIDDLARAAAEELSQVASVVPTTVPELWRLSSAVGYGRLLAGAPAVRSALPAGEQAVAGAGAALRSELARSLDWERGLRGVASGLQEERPEELEHALVAAEELLAIAPVVGAGAAAEAFCDRAERLLAWLPAEWSHLATSAAARCRWFDGEESLAGRLWSAVEGAAAGALLREVAPAVRPAATLVDAVLPVPAAWSRWRARASALGAEASAAVRRWAEGALSGLAVERLAPAMGARSAEWVVRGRPAAAGPRYRLFAVDADHPEGYEVTERFTASDGQLWQMTPEDEGVLFVLVASEGEQPLPGVGLAGVLGVAAARADVSVTLREISRPR